MKGFIILFFCAYSWSLGLEGDWYTKDKQAIVSITKVKNTFEGKITWLVKEDRYKVDDKNPNKALHERPILGLPLLEGFKAESESVFSDGRIYDPKSGKTYKCILTLENENTLEVRGYIGISLFGRTEVWKRAIKKP